MALNHSHKLAARFLVNYLQQCKGVSHTDLAKIAFSGNESQQQNKMKAFMRSDAEVPTINEDAIIELREYFRKNFSYRDIAISDQPLLIDHVYTTLVGESLLEGGQRFNPDLQWAQSLVDVDVDKASLAEVSFAGTWWVIRASSNGDRSNPRFNISALVIHRRQENQKLLSFDYYYRGDGEYQPTEEYRGRSLPTNSRLYFFSSVGSDHVHHMSMTFPTNDSRNDVMIALLNGKNSAGQQISAYCRLYRAPPETSVELIKSKIGVVSEAEAHAFIPTSGEQTKLSEKIAESPLIVLR